MTDSRNSLFPTAVDGPRQTLFFSKRLNRPVSPDDLAAISAGDFLVIWAECKQVVSDDHPDVAHARKQTARHYIEMCELLKDSKLS